VEALGFSGISAAEDQVLREFLGEVLRYGMDEEVIEGAVRLRQQRRMKLGDAIIGATALEYGVPLVTRNVDEFKHIAGLQIINPFAASL
jgi:predicted nucleic acid-binding protein